MRGSEFACFSSHFFDLNLNCPSQPRSGKCFTCGIPGHWSTECPRNPRSIASSGALSADPSTLVGTQRREPQDADEARGWGFVEGSIHSYLNLRPSAMCLESVPRFPSTFVEGP